MRKTFVLMPLVLLGACQQQATTPPAKADTQAASNAIGKLENAQIAAINAKDPAAATALYGDDAVLITDSSTTNGTPQPHCTHLVRTFSVWSVRSS